MYFDFQKLDSFWRTDKEGHLDMNQETEDCYFIFVFEFCPCTSNHWKNYLKVLVSCTEASFRQQLTTSDEAYTAWFIYNMSRTFGSADEKSDFKIAKGKKYSCLNEDVYTDFFTRVANFRANEDAYIELQRRMFQRYFKKDHVETKMKRKQTRSELPYSDDFN